MGKWNNAQSRGHHIHPSFGRRLSIERLEPRLLLAGDTYLINFQLAGAPVPTRYLADTGQVFGDRGNGLSFGWSSDHTDVSRDRGVNADQRLDTLIHFHLNQNWELALPNGMYEVTVEIGDPSNPSTYTLNVEGANYWNAVALAPNNFLVKTQQVMVTDGRLTLNQGAAEEKATRIDFIHVVGLPSGTNAAPATPTITEPAIAGQVVNPADVHMEASGYSDPDGNAHKSTDWEIWTTGASPQVVWQTLGITGVERGHTHLGDGVFINSLAGAGLLPNTDYQLHVRFRDDVGSISSYATRDFHTGAASTIFALEIQDVAALPAPQWISSVGSNVILPAASPNQSQLRIESAAGDLLLSIAGNNGIVNVVTNPPTLSDHAELRVVVTGGSAGLVVGQTTLAFSDDHGQSHTLYLPAINLTAGQRLDLWVASDGSTYYGTAAQTSPSFLNLARPSDTAVANPFTPMQPGYVVEVVATGLRLPVNIAFVPDPGPDPDDPLYYVTELYGSIQVVRRDGTRQTFATGLLDYNPQGPISGSGEQGLTGLAVERDSINPEIYHLYAGMLWDNGSPPGNAEHYPKVERIDSSLGGLSMATRTVLLNMQPETQGQSHQISNISIGPDHKLYVHNGDGFDATKGQDLNSFRGKVLRMNLDGSAPSDNPFYNAANGITATDYVFAYGLRNPFGGAWRELDGRHYEVENGPSVDRLARIDAGVNYLYDGSDSSMFNRAIYNWNPAHAPVNLTFVQQSIFDGSQFPAGKLDHLFVSESGPTYAEGPQSAGKRIVEFVLDANGNRLSGPTNLVVYTGAGVATAVGLAAGPDGLYFTELYDDLGANGPTAAGARIFRIRYVNPLAGDYDIDGDVDANDYAVWKNSFGSNLLLAADGNRDGVVDAADYAVWRDNLGKTLPAAGAGVNALIPTSLAAATAPAHSVADAPVAQSTPAATPFASTTIRSRRSPRTTHRGPDQLALLAVVESSVGRRESHNRQTEPICPERPDSAAAADFVFEKLRSLRDLL